MVSSAPSCWVPQPTGISRAYHWGLPWELPPGNRASKMGFEAEAWGESRRALQTSLCRQWWSWRGGGGCFSGCLPPRFLQCCWKFCQHKKFWLVLYKPKCWQKTSPLSSCLIPNISACAGRCCQVSEPPPKGGHLPCYSHASSSHNPISGCLLLGFMCLLLCAPHSPRAPASLGPSPGVWRAQEECDTSRGRAGWLSCLILAP